MKFLLTGTAILFCITMCFSQENCVYNAAFIPTESFPTDGKIFDANTHIDFFDLYIVLNEINYSFIDKKTYPFVIKDDLLRSFKCAYDFYDHSEQIEGKLVEYYFDEEIKEIGHELSLITIIDCGIRFNYVLTDQGFYLFKNEINYSSRNLNYYELAEAESKLFEYVHNLDTTISVEFSTEPVFELVTEQYLYKPAYQELESVPAVYDSIYHYYHSEISNCPEAIRDTIELVYIVKDNFLSYDIIKPVFEKVNEIILKRAEYAGPHFYKREKIDSQTLLTNRAFLDPHNLEVTNFCQEIHFLPCLEVGIDNAESIDTTIHNFYLACRQGYNAAGKYCYNENGIVPAQYEEFEREVMFQPGSIEEVIQVPAEYKTVQVVSIINKDELVANCTEFRKDSILYLSKIEEAAIKYNTIPAEYKTVTKYYLPIDVGELSVDIQEEEIPFSIEYISKKPYAEGESMVFVPENLYSCYKKAIASKLIELSFIEDENFSNYQFYEGLIDYQIDVETKIGVIDRLLINRLGVEF